MDKELTNTSTAEVVRKEPKRLPLWVVLVAFALLIGFMALIGWGLNRSMQGRISNGDSVPAFSMTTFDGETINTASLSGKVIVVNFWASWCKPCEQEARELEQAYQYYKKDGKVVFVGLAYVDTEPNSRDYLQRFGVTYPNGPDLATKTSQMFGVRGVPETFIINKNGKLAYFKAGPFTSVQEIQAVVDGILNQ